MKRFFTLLALLVPLSALADAPAPLGPDGGKFGHWTAATYGSGAAKICYAFTTPMLSTPDWKSRELVMLSVTERQGSQDEVSITPGYVYPQKARVTLGVGKRSIPFYVDEGTAFTSHGAAVLALLAKADSAVVKSTAPHGRKIVTDEFSLAGFSAAHHAILHACP